MRAIHLELMALRIRSSIAAVILAGALIFFAGCSAVTPSSETTAQKLATANFDLAKCEELEPYLYRCPGVDRPLCDPDFARAPIQCLKITKSGVLLQELPLGTL
jgi:hypothetical protein